MDTKYIFLLTGIALLFVLFLVMTILGKRRRILKFIPAFLSSVFFCGALVLCTLASAYGTVIFSPLKTPDEVSSEYMQTCFSENTEPFPAEGALKDALLRSYSYQFTGSSRTDRTEAERDVIVTSLNIPLISEDIKERVHDKLAVLVDERKRSEVYDDANNYRTEILDEVYEEALADSLTNAQAFYSTTDVRLNLSYSDGQWWVTPSDSLKSALDGGVPQGADLTVYTKSEALKDLTYIPKIYSIDENATRGPKPNASNYGSTQDPSEIAELIDAYPALTGGKESFFHTDADFRKENIYYYADETILTCTWREILQGHTCTFSEVYVAHPSQFRRKLAGDSYGSPIQKYASEMARETNSVVAMNGDFYKFRAEGVTVYNRELYRFNPNKLELCHIDRLGHLNFTYAGDITTEEDMKQYIRDHDILFTLAFGPVLVENYEPHDYAPHYLLGQIETRYSRSVLCTGGDCHYLLMTINHGYNPNTPTVTIAETQEILLAKKVENAYVLDGGQTAEIIMQDRVSNHIDFDTERTVSDILYFVTALPEDEEQ